MKKTLGSLLLLTLLAFSAARGQSIESLREQIRKAEADIRTNTALLDKTRKDQQVNQSQLKLIQARISSRRSIVRSLEQQLDLLGNDILVRNNTIADLNSSLVQLKKEYAEMIRAAYKNYKLNDFLLFLFASKDFNDATRRIDFMRRYNRMREEKAAEIKAVSTQITAEVEKLDARRAELDQTRTSRTKELTALGRDETQYASAVRQLKAKESKISKELQAKRAEIEKAQKQLEKIIAEEARKSKNTKRSSSETQYDIELTGRFDQNMGKLPLPVRGGVIIDHFGVHPHPTQSGLMVNNKGVNIAADKGAEVLCVFEGNVVRIFTLPGLNNCIMVRHGNYFTIYTNLATVSVKTGDKVAINQRVGKLASSNNSDDNVLHFEIWKEGSGNEPQYLNPEQWLNL